MVESVSEALLVSSLEQVRKRAEDLAGGPGRRILGIAGPPGAGKTTLATWVEQQLNSNVADGRRVAAQIPMDGFHLPNAVLVERGLRDRKGAPETFDVVGYENLLKKVRNEPESDHAAPGYSRELHEPVMDAHLIPACTKLIISEGNYLLGGTPEWDRVSSMFDEIWFVFCDERVIRQRLIERQMVGGKKVEDAVEWVDRSDMANLRFVDARRKAANLEVRLSLDALSPFHRDCAGHGSVEGRPL